MKYSLCKRIFLCANIGSFFFCKENEREEAEKRKLQNEKQGGKEMEKVDSNEEEKRYRIYLSTPQPPILGPKNKFFLLLFYFS